MPNPQMSVTGIDQLTMKLDGEDARTIFFALSDYRDKILSSIADLVDPYKDVPRCEEHQYLDIMCGACRTSEELRLEAQKVEGCRDEECLFLGDILSKVGGLLFQMGADNHEVSEWLSV